MNSTIETYLWLYLAGLSIILRIILLQIIQSNSRSRIGGFKHENHRNQRSDHLIRMLEPPAHIGKKYFKSAIIEFARSDQATIFI